MVLKLEPMTKARVICMQADTARVVDALYDFGTIHLTRSRQGTPGTPLQEFREISEELIFLRATEKALGIRLTPEAGNLEPRERLVTESKKVREEIEELKRNEAQLAEYRALMAQLKARIAELKPFENLSVRPTTFSQAKTLSLHYFELKSNRKEFEKDLAKLPIKTLFVTSDRPEYALVAVGTAKKALLLEKTAKHAVELAIPTLTERESFASALAGSTGELERVERDAAKLAGRQAAYSVKNASRIARLRCQLEEYGKKAELPNRFGRTQALEIIEGWVTSRKFKELERKILEVTKNKATVEAHATKKNAPTVLKNPPLVRRFEFMVRFFSLPNQAEYDPTLFISITFPIIFGMIFGDIGYGLLTMALASFLYLKAQKGFWRHLAGMMLLSGFFTTVWGFVFGEFMGVEDIFGYELHAIIHRTGHGVPILMVAALLVGVIHLGFGLAVGAYTNWRHGHKSHAYAKMSWIVLEAAFLLAGINLFAPYIFNSPAIIIALVIASVVALYKFEGVPAVVEIPGLLSNLLSYLRIMALGLSGVILAQIVNQIPFKSSLESIITSATAGDLTGVAIGILPAIFFGVVLILGHAVALGLGLFEAGIQSLRLHYVEFFSKFYHGGGIPFVPLREK
ncbi:hypothetical protein AUJ14_03175 [Candidatus Micrarchaeota archaeon CG1_02_55_22]|nr:MAG: hypothetical protein AUJ14_03175 [Candidatus Micrarchaeota archaeon CG1_02_55_22]